MRTLDAVSLRPSSLALIDRVQAGRIARELEEAAQALEAGPWMPIETAPKETEVLVWFGPVVGVKSATYTELFGDAVWFWCVTDGKFNPHPVRRYCAPYPTHWMPLPAPPSAQVAQEGDAGVATDGGGK